MEVPWLALVTWGHFAVDFLPLLPSMGRAGAQPYGIPMILKTEVMK